MLLEICALGVGSGYLNKRAVVTRKKLNKKKWPEFRKVAIEKHEIIKNIYL
jgi:hypothetical protein